MNSDRSVEKKGRGLEGKRIAYGICGGIGAVESVRIIRELRRHGAEITAFLTPSALRFITELSVSWAANRPAICEVGAEAEHIEIFDAIVIAPLTLNTLSKFALGIADDPVSLLVASQLSVKPVLALVPTMNVQMEEHPLYAEYRKKLETWGARFFPSAKDEGRFKMPSPEAFADWMMGVCHAG